MRWRAPGWGEAVETPGLAQSRRVFARIPDAAGQAPKDERLSCASRDSSGRPLSDGSKGEEASPHLSRAHYFLNNS